MSGTSSPRPISRRTSARASKLGRKTAVSKPLGMTTSFSAAKPRRAYSERACSEQQTIRVGTRRDRWAHADTVIKVVRFVTPATWLE